VASEEIKIGLLADHAEAIATLAEWYLLEWEPYYGEDGPGDVWADLKSRCNRKKAPIGLVAMEGNRVCGTIALDGDVTTKLVPSVIGLLVGNQYRRRGIATALLGSAENLARDLGYNQLYVSTTVLADFLERMGWRAIGKVEFLNAEHGSIYVCEL
jgi:GNAT superfamily N-acetyltransferase